MNLLGSISNAMLDTSAKFGDKLVLKKKKKEPGTKTEEKTEETDMFPYRFGVHH